jgi:hypothetical protein
VGQADGLSFTPVVANEPMLFTVVVDDAGRAKHLLRARRGQDDPGGPMLAGVAALADGGVAMTGSFGLELLVVDSPGELSVVRPNDNSNQTHGFVLRADDTLALRGHSWFGLKGYFSEGQSIAGAPDGSLWLGGGFEIRTRIDVTRPAGSLLIDQAIGQSDLLLQRLTDWPPQ